MLTSLKKSNIFDPIQDELDQRIFKGTTPRPAVIRFIKKLRDTVLGKYLPDPEQYFKIFITGSLTTYQYSETSDMDISYFPDYHSLMYLFQVDSPGEVRKNLIQIVIDEMDGRFVPGTQHPIQDFMVPPDVYPQDMYKPGLRSAWDIENDMWFVAPEKDRVHDVSKELPILYQRAEDMADKMEQMLDHDPVYAKQLFKQIHRKRTLDQQRGLGDFSEGNIVYKYLLHKGLFDRLRSELGIYIARRVDDGKEEGIQGMEKTESIRGSQDTLESTQEAQEHVAGNEGEEYQIVYLDLTGYDPNPNFAPTRKPFMQVGNTIYIGEQGASSHGAIYAAIIDKERLEDLLAMQTGWIMNGKIFADGYLNPDIEAFLQRKLGLGDKTAAGRDIANEPVKVIYDFEKDQIILGTPGQVVPQKSKIVGDYDGSNMNLYSTGQEFLNSNYLKRLWHASFPTRPLNNITFESQQLKVRQ
jgi:hypothetical protein